MNKQDTKTKERTALVPLDTLVGCRSKDVKKHLDLFSGIGGFALAAEWAGGFETIAFCEIEKYPKKLLAQNFPGIPIFEDVRKLHAEDLPCKPDVITGGYPCQPFSVAGKQRGEEDDRHLWPEMLRLIQECNPESVICENVAGHIKMGLDTVHTDLENEGYTCWTFIIPACSKGFPHKRDRVWIVANRKMCKRNDEQIERSGEDWESKGKVGGCNSFDDANAQHSGRNATKKQGSNGKAICNGKEGADQARELDGVYSPGDVADANGTGLQAKGTEQQAARFKQYGKLCGSTTFRGFTKPPVCRRDDGIPNRVDRIKGLGNAIVPQIAYELLRCI